MRVRLSIYVKCKKRLRSNQSKGLIGMYRVARTDLGWFEFFYLFTNVREYRFNLYICASVSRGHKTHKGVGRTINDKSK